MHVGLCKCAINIYCVAGVVSLQVQVLENCMGRRFEGIADALLEMVIGDNVGSQLDHFQYQYVIHLFFLVVFSS